MPEQAFSESPVSPREEVPERREPAKILEFPASPDLAEAKEREARITAAIEQYADVFEELVSRMVSVLEMQETRLRDGLKTGTSKAFSHDERELARVRDELQAVRAVAKAMKG